MLLLPVGAKISNLLLFIAACAAAAQSYVYVHRLVGTKWIPEDLRVPRTLGMRGSINPSPRENEKIIERRARN